MHGKIHTNNIKTLKTRLKSTSENIRYESNSVLVLNLYNMILNYNLFINWVSQNKNKKFTYVFNYFRNVDRHFLYYLIIFITLINSLFSVLAKT